MKKLIILSILILAFEAGHPQKGHGRAKAMHVRKYLKKYPKHINTTHSFIFYKENKEKLRPGTT